MKHLSFLVLTIFFSNTSRAQNFPACDTLIINCCSVNISGPNTITLTAANSSSVLFDYPGFAILDSNGDTVAIEMVNYFGIGTSPQIHIMNVVAPFTLPFTGTLQLYMLFYDTLACEFPITIPDTVSGLPEHANQLKIFPNPVQSTFTIDASQTPFASGTIRMDFFDVCGKLVESIQFEGDKPYRCSTAGWPGGMIFYKLYLPGEITTGKLILLSDQ